MMPPPLTLTFAWLATPLVAAGLLAQSSRARGFVSRHLLPCSVLGWAGVALMLVGALSLDTSTGVAAFAIGGPIAGLSIWSRGPGGGEDDDEPPSEPEPPEPEFDWEQFEREFRSYARARERPRRPAPRAPAPRRS